MWCFGSGGLEPLMESACFQLQIHLVTKQGSMLDHFEDGCLIALPLADFGYSTA